MINNIINDIDYTVSIIPKRVYERYVDKYKKYIKGKSEYEDYSLIEYLPRNKEFYVLEDSLSGNETGYEEYCFSIATTYKGMYFIITDRGSN